MCQSIMWSSQVNAWTLLQCLVEKCYSITFLQIRTVQTPLTDRKSSSNRKMPATALNQCIYSVIPHFPLICAADLYIKLSLVGKLASTARTKVAFLTHGPLIGGKEDFLRKETNADILRPLDKTVDLNGSCCLSCCVVFPVRFFSPVNCNTWRTEVLNKGRGCFCFAMCGDSTVCHSCVWGWGVLLASGG